MLVYGPDMVNRRQKMEQGYLLGTNLIEQPSGFVFRYANWTALPSVTPGEPTAGTPGPAGMLS